MLNTTIAEFANIEDPDETAHLDLQCLPSSPLIFNILQFELKTFENFAVCFLGALWVKMYLVS